MGQDGVGARQRQERCLAVVADDFGMAPAVDRAVVALARQGRLSGTSVLSLYPHWPASAPWLTETTLQVGLHVDLPPGHDSLSRAMLAAWTRTLPRHAIESSLERQFDAFDAHRKSPPDYVDGHRHVHQWPRLRDLILDRWQRHYGRPPVWARATRPPAGQGFKARVIHVLGGAAWEKRLRRESVAYNRSFLGVYDFQSDATGYLMHLAGWVRQAPHGTLMMCHPADGVVEGDAIAAARRAEHTVWASEAMGELLRSQHARIATGPELPALWRGGATA